MVVCQWGRNQGQHRCGRSRVCGSSRCQGGVAAYPNGVLGVQKLAALPKAKEVVVDATSERDVTMLENELRHRWGRLDGALHAIVFAPRSPV